MAVLRAISEDRIQPIPARLLIGRSPSCGLRLDEPHASGEHARITWTGTHWEIRDLASRNGTYVDGTKLDSGTAVKIRQGARLAFGDPDRAWELESEAAPGIIAVDLESSDVRTADGGLLVLPSDESPLVSYYQNKTGEWLEEGSDGNIRPIKDDEVVQAGGRSWRIQLPFVSDHTPLIQLHLALESIHLQFAVSRDEERVEITISHRGMDIALEPREHGYVLLTLARARAEDEEMAAQDRGWRDRDQLERMLAMDSNALNVAIHRARQQLVAAGVAGAPGIVEVRRKKRRLGTDRFTITAL